jgi:hypothetical protein
MNEIREFAPQNSLKTAVLFLIFNRPDTTQQVFNEIRKARPAQLFVAADGPRKDRPADYELCKKTREIVQQVDWDCKVLTRFNDENLGCKRAVCSAMDWFFSNVEEGIILEDDCVPDQSFFPFCQELLEKYREDERIMIISGDNLQFGRRRSQHSYYFSRCFNMWGWATWKRTWDLYDVKMELWPKIKEGGWLKDILQDGPAEKYWERIFDDIYNDTYTNKIDTWDYQWVFSCWINGGLSIAPNQNLISNIGFNCYATHTTEDCTFSKMVVGKIEFPLNHPEYIIRDVKADQYEEKIERSMSRLGLIKLIKRIFEISLNVCKLK